MTLQMVSNPDDMSAGEIGRLVVRVSTLSDGSLLETFTVRRRFSGKPHHRDRGAVLVWIHGDCTFAEPIGNDTEGDR